MCCGEPNTLYGTTTATTSVPTVIPTTSYHPPFGTMSIMTATVCASYSASTCVSSTTTDATAFIDYFFGLNVTTSVTAYIPATVTELVPTATLSTPCTTTTSAKTPWGPYRGLEEGELEGLEKRGDLEEFEKRGAAPSLRVLTKSGVLLMGLLMAPLTL